MTRKLAVLNLALLAVAVYAGVQLRDLYAQKKAREEAMRNRKIAPLPPPPVTPLPQAQPVAPASYAAIATQQLFDKSRDSKVVIEPPPPPPPPPPVPAFPVLRGMMNLGDGLTAVFSAKASDPPMEVKPGERIGQFTLVSVNEQEAVFAWNGKNYRKAVEEILDRSKEQSGDTSRAAPAAPSAAAPAAVVKTPTGPGQDVGSGIRACNPNDSTAAGAVVDGYRKVVSRTPFGESCRWEAAGR
jgi:hypothetical protein